MEPGTIVALVFLIAIVALTALVIYALVKPTKYKKHKKKEKPISEKKYVDFVLKHSLALRTLWGINANYQFRDVQKINFEHDYDFQNAFNNITCKDYLVYQLVNTDGINDAVKTALKDALFNNELFKKYEREISEKCPFGQYDTTELPKNLNKLAKAENEIIKLKKLHPTTIFSITVSLDLVDYRGMSVDSNSESFYPKQLKDIIFKINQKDGDYYLYDEIWDSLCKVERGKIDRNLREQILARDNHRCKHCGSTENLEIDHIVPISKGGKSTPDNLQVLCHDCNMEKSTETIRY